MFYNECFVSKMKTTNSILVKMLKIKTIDNMFVYSLENFLFPSSFSFGFQFLIFKFIDHFR